MFCKKKGLVYLIISGLIFTHALTFNVNHEEEIKTAFINSLIQVESSGRDNAISKDGSAGPLQIQAVLVKDINRRLKISGDTTRFTLQDRFCRQKAIRMFWIYQRYYGKKNDSFEQMARRWNGGPCGVKSKKTEKYWKKVNRTLVSMLKDRVKKSES